MMVHVVLVHDLLDLLCSHEVAQLREGVAQSRPCQLMRAIHVELLEERGKTLWCEVLLDGEGCSDEVVVVDHTIAIEVDLLNDSLQLLVAHLLVALADCCSQFVDLERA